MLKKKRKIKIDLEFTHQYVNYVVKELFVADGIRWVRCVDDKEENKYFTEREILRILK